MLDAITIQVAGGTGGHGLTSFHREKFVPKGGPDGGDGGRGGRVYFRAVDDVYTLEQYRSKKKFRAGSGGNGGPNLRHGAVGDDLTLEVPAGTVITDEEMGDVLADLVHVGDEVLVAHGGRGGWGNKRFASSTNQAPNFSQKGHDGELLNVRLELRLLADVGLIGLPNAGKSTLLAAMSNAKPKIASYPFTTLEPMLGVVLSGYDRFTMADLPGLVEGASEGYGLGFEFLKHIRRCRVLLHLVDSTSPDPVTDFELIEGELRAYDPTLDEVARVVAVTKVDLDWDGAQGSAATLSSHLGRPVRLIAAIVPDGNTEPVPGGSTGAAVPGGKLPFGTDDLAAELMALVKTERARADEAAAAELHVIRPESRERFTVEQVGTGAYAVEGQRVVQFVEMMDTDMEGSRAEVDRRLERWGVAKALRRVGVKPGDKVTFGETTIEWE
ncbi:MAG: GTPase ObgE [Chloroflexi bacterium]|nr:GTPase ObgE [Chloroflexota bacterium]